MYVGVDARPDPYLTTYMATNQSNRNGNTDRANEAIAKLTEQVIEAMETDPGSWSKPWTSALVNAGVPYSIGTGNAYTGGNVWIALGEMINRGYGYNAWGTFNQWAKFLGAKKTGRRFDRQIVRKGEKATYLLRPRKITVDTDRHGNPLPEGVTRTIVIGFDAFPVFNAAQVEGAEAKLAEAGADFEPFTPIERAERFVTAVGADVRHVAGDAAYYDPAADRITLPMPEQFVEVEGYYATYVHELGHWTGAEHRLNREGIVGKRTTASYGFEELVAELTAVFVGAGRLGLSVEPRPDHVKYLAHWVSVLKEEPKVLWQAASKAQKAAEFLAEKAEAGAPTELAELAAAA